MLPEGLREQLASNPVAYQGGGQRDYSHAPWGQLLAAINKPLALLVERAYIRLKQKEENAGAGRPHFGHSSLKLATPARTLRSWAVSYNWHARADARDREAEARAAESVSEKRRLEIERQNQEIIEMRKRHAQLAKSFQAKVIERLTQMDASELTLSQMATWFDISVKIERLSRGEPTEILDERMETEKRLSQMSDEELDAYIAKCEKAEAERSTGDQ